MSKNKNAGNPTGQSHEQKAPSPNVNLAGRHPCVLAKDPYYARHEAAHGITLDDKKWTVYKVDLDNRQTHADMEEFLTTVRQTEWKNPIKREAMKPGVRDYITTVVAGFLAEYLVGSPELPISARLQEKGWLLEAEPTEIKSDLDRTVYFLQLIQRNTLEEVVAAEKRAEEILTRRKDDYEALVKMLIDKRVVTGPDLEEALGKEVNRRPSVLPD